MMIMTGTLPARCDAIFFPLQYSLFCYSGEAVYSFEKVKSDKKTTSYWTGIGCVGSIFYPLHPVLGIEAAVEKRHYFRPGIYERFLFSYYLGTAYMTNFGDISDIGIIPGAKITYKASRSGNLVIEPYAGLSMPLAFNLEYLQPRITLPTVTLGVRFGINVLSNNH